MEEVLITFFLFVLLPVVLMNGIRKIKSDKAAARGLSGAEMTASELRAMVRDAVDDAVAPLSARVADLEERLGDESVASLRARLDPALLADLAEADLAEADLGDAGEEPAAVRRRTR